MDITNHISTRDGRQARSLRGARRASDRFRAAARQAALGLRCQRGDTLIEVLVAALVLATVVIGTLNGLNAVTSASALSRARTQAQALAEQDEERLRSEPISAIQSLAGSPQTHTVTLGKTKYTVVSTVELISEQGSSLCTEGSVTAGTYRTTSEVRWWGGHGDHHLSATSDIAPPPGAALLVQFEGAEKGTPVAGMETTLVGPEENPAESREYRATSTNSGCAIFGPFKSGGQYTLNAKRTGYVDINSKPTLAEDPAAARQLHLIGNTLTKAKFRFAEAGKLKIALRTEKPPKVKGTWEPATKVPNVVIANNETTPEARTLRATSGTYSESIESEAPYLFPLDYTLYAGLCPANSPYSVAELAPAQAQVTSGQTALATLTLPALVVRVYLGTEETTANLVAHPKIVLADTQCPQPLVLEYPESETLSNTTTIEEQGDLLNPGIPAGIYTVCTEWQSGGKTFSAAVTEQHIPSPLQNYAEVALLRGLDREAECPR